MSRTRANKNVSVQMLSRADKRFVAGLNVKLRQQSNHGNAKAQCWKYFGHLFNDADCVDNQRLYCSLCLTEEQENEKFHISNVANFALTTSSGNLNQHLSVKHHIEDSRESSVNTMFSYFAKYDHDANYSASNNKPPSRSEFIRDLVIWFCRDLMPFNAVEKMGMVDFFRKNFPDIELPAQETLSGTALNDVYHATRTKVCTLLQGISSACVMFDGWTDRYRAKPYFGIRLAFVKNWKFFVITLSCEVVPSHTGEALADQVQKVLAAFHVDTSKIMLTSCHDGAANMRKASKLLKVDSYQHCVAHALHLLLTTDSINVIEDLSNLVQRCRDIVTALHFKTYELEEDVTALEDLKVIEKLKNKMSTVSETLDLDNQYGQSAEEYQKETAHTHTTLKGSCPTRWNSVLVMIESISDMLQATQNSLKRIGRADLCLKAAEVSLLKELTTFLKPFERFTELVGTHGATLALLPLFKLHITKLCVENVRDDDAIKALKGKIMERLDFRLPDNKHCQIHQVLEPSTKCCVTKEIAVTLLQETYDAAIAKGYISEFQSESDYGNISQVANSSQMTYGAEKEDQELPVKKKKLKHELLNEMRSVASSSRTRNDVTLEVEKYLAYPVEEKYEDEPLEFWRIHCAAFPRISKLAEMYLGMASASVAVESMFSVTGLIANHRRSSLSPHKLNRIVFIHDNFEVIKGEC